MRRLRKATRLQNERIASPMNMPLLYTYRRCPFAMRARMALLVADVAFDAFEISLRDKPPDMLALSPKGTVPVTVSYTHLDVYKRQHEYWCHRG